MSRDPSRRCSATACTCSSSTGPSRPAARPTTPRSSTSASRTPAPTARSGRSRCAASRSGRTTGRTSSRSRGPSARRPHAYRRADLTAVEKALRPYSEADAATRVAQRRGPAPGGRHPGRSRRWRRPRARCGTVVDHADGQGHAVHPDDRRDDRAVPALVRGLRRDAHVRDAVPPRRPARRPRARARHLSPGAAPHPALARRPGRRPRPPVDRRTTARSTWCAASCTCSAR